MRPLFIRIPKVASSSVRVVMGKDWGERVKPRNTHAAHVQAAGHDGHPATTNQTRAASQGTRLAPTPQAPRGRRP